jgi:hypothetical protein
LNPQAQDKNDVRGSEMIRKAAWLVAATFVGAPTSASAEVAEIRLSRQPTDWKELFFPEVHNLPGS